jgi:hypothetical protein
MAKVAYRHTKKSPTNWMSRRWTIHVKCGPTHQAPDEEVGVREVGQDAGAVVSDNQVQLEEVEDAPERCNP